MSKTTIKGKNKSLPKMKISGDGSVVDFELTSGIYNTGGYDYFPLENKSYWDDGMYRLYGLSKKSLDPKFEHILKVIHPDDKDRIKTIYVDMLDPSCKDTSYTVGYRIIIDGTIRHLIAHGYLFRNSKGIVERVMGISQDATELNRTLVELRESEQRFQRLASAAFEGILISDQGNILDANDRLLEMFGVTRQEIVGRSVLEFTHPDSRHKLIGSIQSGTEDTLEVQALKKDGTVFDVEMQAKGIPYKGNMLQVTAVKDVTEKRRADSALKENENNLKLIYENTNDLLSLMKVQPQGFIIESTNKAPFQLSPSDLVGLDLDYILREIMKFSEEDIQYRLDKHKQAVTGGKPIIYLEEIPYEGQVYFRESQLTPIFQNEQVTRLLMVSRDVTEREEGTKRLKEAFDEVNRLKAKLERENIYLREEIQLTNNFEDMVFGDSSFKELLNQVEQVAPLEATVLLTGETGTGKELIARAIHNISPRASHPMIKINCGAIPKNLVESELFGYEKGAFTGAIAAKPGRLELADGGTLLLDEIGELPMDIQVKLLRVLQESEFERLGSTKTTKVNIRVVAATCRNLKKEILNGNFREDLFFRLNVFPIQVPPLRERMEDIPLLVEHFVQKYNTKHAKHVSHISDEAMSFFRRYPWPGNIRELENVIERSVILSKDGNLLVPEADTGGQNKPIIVKDQTLDQAQRNHIKLVLAECNWRVEGKDGAAEKLGVKPSTLRDRMKKLDITRPT